jgi:hypothetical protein
MRPLTTLVSLIWISGAVAMGADKPAAKSGAAQDSGKQTQSSEVKKTPFGTVKRDDKAEPEKVEPPDNMRAFEEGDVVRFERRTPFSVNKWSKKKAELDEVEQAVVERERLKRGK